MEEQHRKKYSSLKQLLNQYRLQMRKFQELAETNQQILEQLQLTKKEPPVRQGSDCGEAPSGEKRCMAIQDLDDNLGSTFEKDDRRQGKRHFEGAVDEVAHAMGHPAAANSTLTESSLEQMPGAGRARPKTSVGRLHTEYQSKICKSAERRSREAYQPSVVQHASAQSTQVGQPVIA